MLRKIRIVTAIICFTLISLLFLDFTGTLHTYFGWLAKIQLVPAILALNIGVLVFLVLLTFVFGRVYCSIICPMGVFQDFISWMAKKRKKYRFKYSSAISWLRYSILAIFIAALIIGISAVVSVIEPYSAYGRIASNLFAPIYLWVNNFFAYLAERADSYAFYSVDVWIKSLSTFIVAIVTFVAIAILAWRNGRIYCNSICPVGTFLGFISRFSLFKPRINSSDCNNCGLCEKVCRASCINSKEQKIDYSRCVSCMDCVDVCTKSSLKYSFKLKNEKTVNEDKSHDDSKRKFLVWTAIFAGTSAVKAQTAKVDGGLALLEDKKVPNRTTNITPAGSEGIRKFSQHCTSCQLCVSVCPNQVLRPSNDLSRFMQPEMSFERGYCRPECTKCSEVCPAGAIKPIDVAEKSSTQIGHAILIKENCIAITDGVSCGNCARHCPAGAIFLTKIDDGENSYEMPVVDTERCIGCGACEYHCPARPFSAIYVEGHERHRII